MSRLSSQRQCYCQYERPLTGHLPTHSLSVICRATVLWTRKGSPEPLPEVQEWSSRSWEREIQKQRVKSLYIYMCLSAMVCVCLQVCYLNENLPKGIPLWFLLIPSRDEIRSIWDSDCDSYKQAAFDVAPTWDGRGQAVCATILCAWVGVCVCAGGAECPLLRKQQKCHPLPSDWCGRAGDFI